MSTYSMRAACVYGPVRGYCGVYHDRAQTGGSSPSGCGCARCSAATVFPTWQWSTRPLVVQSAAGHYTRPIYGRYLKGVWMRKRLDIKAILRDPVQRKRLMVELLIATQAREGIVTTMEQAEAAYESVRREVPDGACAVGIGK
jgi:hypothetical protein